MLDVTEETKLIEIFGQSKDKSQEISLLSTITKKNGNFKMNLNLPFLGIVDKNYEGNYTVLENDIIINALFNNDAMSVEVKKNQSSIDFKVITPFNGMENVKGILKLDYTTNIFLEL